VSHHLDAPQGAQNGQLYIDDLYAFSAGGSTCVPASMMRSHMDVAGPGCGVCADSGLR
jgi:hypothetical protein